MTKFNTEMELAKAYAEHMNTVCEDSFYLEDLNRVEMYSLRGGYTPMNAKDMGITTTSKYILYVPEFGYTEVA